MCQKQPNILHSILVKKQLSINKYKKLTKELKNNKNLRLFLRATLKAKKMKLSKKGIKMEVQMIFKKSI